MENRSYITPQKSAHSESTKNREKEKIIGASIVALSIGLLGLASVATFIVVKGEPVNFRIGQTTIIDYQKNTFTNPPSQNLLMFEGYCSPSSLNKPQNQRSKQFLFSFTADGSPTTDVDIIEICH